MNIATNIEAMAGNYHGMVFTSGLTPSEQQAIGYFGEPVIDVGGTFTGSETPPGSMTPVALSFSFTTALRRIVTDLPVKQIFKLSDSANAYIEAELYVATLSTRITTAMSAILAGFSPTESSSATFTPRPFPGLFQIPASVDHFTISGLALSFTPIGCTISVMMPNSSGQLLSATPDLSTLTTAGVTVYLTSPTPTAGYIASYSFF